MPERLIRYTRTPQDLDHDLLARFLAHVLDAHKAGLKSREDAIADIAHLASALDKGAGVGDDPNAYMRAILEHEGNE